MRRFNMGSREEGLSYTLPEDFITPDEAADILKICPKTMRKYLRLGILRGERVIRGKNGLAWRVRREDVNALKAIGNWGLRTIDIWDLLQGIKIRLHSLDEKINFLMRVNGIDVSVLRDASTETLLALYDEAEDFLEIKIRKIRPDVMLQWAEIFLQFSEIEFERLVAPTLQQETWQPFYRLCLSMMKDLRRRKKFQSSLNSQRTYRLLDKARRSLVAAAAVFTKSRASNLGPTRVPNILRIGLRKDTLDRYIEAEVV